MTTHPTPEALAADIDLMLAYIGRSAHDHAPHGYPAVQQMTLDKCGQIIRTLSAELAAARAQCAGYLDQHHRDSAELRRLNQARDDETKARKQAQEALYAERDRATAAVKAEQQKHSATIAERDSLRAERDDLARWKSTHAPRIEALQGLKDRAQAEAAKGAEAIASLASEREANAILTAEVEALKLDYQRLMDKHNALHINAANSRAEVERVRKDGARIDYLEYEVNELRTRETAEDDYEWIVRSNHMDQPYERDVSSGKTIREAVDRAMAPPVAEGE